MYGVSDAYGNSDAQSQRYESTTPGTVVHSDGVAQQNAYPHDGSTHTLATVTSSASAATDYGINRVSAAGGFVRNTSTIPGLSQIEGPFPFYSDPIAIATSGAISLWYDRWTVTGGAPNTAVSVTVHGTIDFDLTASGRFLEDVRTNAFIAQARFFVPSVENPLVADTVDFIAAAGPSGHGLISWSQTFSVGTYSSIDVAAEFRASDTPANIADYNVDGGASVAFSAMHTSKITSIELPDGYSLTSESGQIVAHDGAFAYQAVLNDSALPVPEPSTYAFMLAGLGVVGFTARRNKRLLG